MSNRHRLDIGSVKYSISIRRRKFVSRRYRIYVSAISTRYLSFLHGRLLVVISVRCTWDGACPRCIWGFLCSNFMPLYLTGGLVCSKFLLLDLALAMRRTGLGLAFFLAVVFLFGWVVFLSVILGCKRRHISLSFSKRLTALYVQLSPFFFVYIHAICLDYTFVRLRS